MTGACGIITTLNINVLSSLNINVLSCAGEEPQFVLDGVHAEFSSALSSEWTPSETEMAVIDAVPSMAVAPLENASELKGNIALVGGICQGDLRVRVVPLPTVPSFKMGPTNVLCRRDSQCVQAGQSGHQCVAPKPFACRRAHDLYALTRI